MFEKNLNFEEFSIEETIFILSIQHSAKLIDHDIFSKTLSSFINAKLKKFNESNNLSCKYFIAGLGSFGSAEMHFSSDVDLIVVAENISKHKNIQSTFQKYFTDAKSYLKPFEVDFRLRPEGKNSPLVWDIETYTAYLKSRARIWEYQSLIKMNFVEGDQNLFERFRLEIKEYSITDASKIKSELLGMSKKIQQHGFKNIQGDFNLKKNRGGILNIDFIVHSVLMTNKKWYSDNFHKGIIEKLNYIIAENKNYNDLEELIDIYHFYKTLELAVQNILGTNTSSVPTDIAKRKTISKWMGIENLDQKIMSSRKTVNLIFEKYLGK